MPVYNAQATLAAQVDELLEVLPEMADDFEILIVDDGSTDVTYEVGVELSYRFPQVQITRLPVRMGTAVAVRTGIQRTCGEVILVQDQPGNLNSNDLRRLWALRNEPNLVIARADGQQRPLNTGAIHRLLEWGAELQKSGSAPNQGGIQMIRRQAIHRLSDLDSSETGLKVKTISRTDAAQLNRRKPERQIVSERLERLTRST